MIKRANKITALVVAAASIMSLVPAMAATRLTTKDGTIENAVAFKDGKYLYEGYRTDDDEKALYFNAGDKDKKLDDATDFDTTYGKYENKYVAAEDGSDKYLVDLSTGKVTDDDTAPDFETTAQTKLQTKLSKTDRYGKDSAKVVKFYQIENSKNRFGDVWYTYSATTGASVNSLVTTNASANMNYVGYTNKSGAYIDVSNDANIYVYNGYKMVKLENIGDADTDKEHNVTVKLDSIEHVRTLGQDDKYLYRLIKVHVTGAQAVGTGTEVTTNNFVKSTPDLYYVQKISKAQGDKEKDAYLPKTTESYQLDSKATIGDGDVEDAWKTLINDADANKRFTYVLDGAIYSTFRDGEKVKTVKMNLKTSQKLYKDNDSKNGKVDGHVVVKDTDKDTKIEDQNGDAEAWSVDINGNVWAIRDGEIKKSTKCGDFKTIYTVDRSFDSLDVYDEDNLIAWNQDKEGYTTVKEGKTKTDTPTTTTTTGWNQLADGTWNYYDASGNKIINNWQQIGNDWYYLDANGAMATGWVQSGSNWYYLNPVSDGYKGAMKTGWQYIDGNWFYLNPISDGTRGAMKTGWQQLGGLWYYLNPVSDGTKGAMKTGWQYVNGNWYYLNPVSGGPLGAMLVNTRTPDGYYVGVSGALV